MSKQKRVGVLTGGGDAPGLNPAIKGLVYRGSELGLTVIGLFDGWRSLINPLPDSMELDRETVRRWDRDGGTNLGRRVLIHLSKLERTVVRKILQRK
jgi:6-phosphofructokinase 1